MNTLELLSPRTLLAVLALALLTFTWVPPAYYAHAMGEPDLMFGDRRLYIFLASSLAALMIGVCLARALPEGSRAASGRALVRMPPALHLLLPAAVALALLVLTVRVLLAHNAAIPGLLLAGRAEDAKIVAIHASQGAFTGSLPCAIATMWWLVLRSLTLPGNVSRSTRLLARLALAALALAVLAVALLLVARSVLLPALFGALLIYLGHIAMRGRLPVRRLLWLALLCASGVLGIFIVFAIARGFDTIPALVGNLVGYGPGSVNHLAALLDGRFDTAALATYLKLQNFGFIYHFPLITRLTGEHPGDLGALSSAFSESARAGLNGSYIWMTAFGEIWAGLRWWAYPYLMIVGLLFGWCWRGFRQQRTFGTLLYGWVAFGVLFYFGSNYLASGYLANFALTSMALSIYERIAGCARFTQKAAPQDDHGDTL